MDKLKQYAYNIALATIQFLNVVLGGDPDGSLSARLGFAYLTGKPKWWVKPAMWLNDKVHYLVSGEVNHSINAVEPEENYEKELWHWYKKD